MDFPHRVYEKRTPRSDAAFYGQCHFLAKHHQFGAENTELTGSPAGWLAGASQEQSL